MEGLFLPLMLALAVAFLFISFRNNKKRQAAQAELKAQAVPGARVQLSCGLYGTIAADEGGDTVDVEIAPGVVTTWNRLAIRDVLTEQPAADVHHDDVEVDETDVEQPRIDLEKDASAASADDAPTSDDTADSKDK